MTRTAVNKENFEESLGRVKSGQSTFYVPTYTRVYQITRINIQKWEEVGKQLLKPEGEGFRMALGKGSVYVLAGQLIEVSN